ncbi:molecular chaperone TorD family protein [Alphaproteobacteria bacterium]|nr:molecular chaperone TorD family protein [Alphaproteobacteria bacterium]MDC0644838.1 molecular chaperone TorD family protein [Alphaproteobacteria bacterium]
MSANEAVIDNQPISEEDSLRADMYDFLASLLRAEPSDELIEKVAQLQGDGTAIGSACLTLAHLAKSIDNGLIRNEYVEMFIGVGRGEILPFASYYLTGFLNDKPLANLRADMAKIGIVRVDGVKEPEDHIASLFDMMAGLIRGEFGRPFSIAEQAAFFNKHIEPWAGLLMRDIEAAKTVVFFAPVGTIGKAFLEIESTAFSMDGTG